MLFVPDSKILTGRISIPAWSVSLALVAQDTNMSTNASNFIAGSALPPLTSIVPDTVRRHLSGSAWHSREPSLQLYCETLGRSKNILSLLMFPSDACPMTLVLASTREKFQNTALYAFLRKKPVISLEKIYAVRSDS